MTYIKYTLESHPLPDGRKLVVYAFNGDLKEIPDDIYNSNVELFDADGKFLWRVRSQGKSHSNFVGANVVDGGVEVINCDGLAFKLSLKDGDIDPIEWRK